MDNIKSKAEQDAIEWALFLKEIEEEEEQKKRDQIERSKIILFPQKRRQQAIVERKYCYDCENYGRVIMVDANLYSHVFSCYCEKGRQWLGFPVYDKRRLGFSDARAAK